MGLKLKEQIWLLVEEKGSMKNSVLSLSMNTVSTFDTICSLKNLYPGSITKYGPLYSGLSGGEVASSFTNIYWGASENLMVGARLCPEILLVV